MTSATTTRPWGLPNLLDTAPSGISILSLDCFDTLLWRNMNLPVDLFADLPLPGGGIEPRMWGENKARRIVPYTDDRYEVTIDEIYAHVMPQADEATRAAAVQRELDAEAAHCYGFEPTRDLMVAAKLRGMKIIIVSDTYLSEPRLRALITAAAGPEVANLIDRIFCSCEYGVSKSGGLFTHVLAELGVSPLDHPARRRQSWRRPDRAGEARHSQRPSQAVRRRERTAPAAGSEHGLADRSADTRHRARLSTPPPAGCAPAVGGCRYGAGA